MPPDNVLGDLCAGWQAVAAAGKKDTKGFLVAGLLAAI